MRIPSNLTEEEVVTIIYKVVDILAGKFRFGYHSIEDMRQEGARFAIEAMNKGLYDETRPLANFLYTHIRNRFINYKRNTYIRNEPPCRHCIFYDPHLKKSINQCSAFEDKLECKKFTDWQDRNATKQSLMRPGSISEDSRQSEIDLSDNMSFAELKDKIRNELPLEVASDYLRMLEGVSISKARRDKVKEAVLRITARYNEEDVEDV